MNTITQTMRVRQVLIEYSFKNGVTKAAIRYKVNRQYVYRWRKRYDGTLQSLADKSHRPHHHPNEHTSEELKLIADMRKRNINAGLVVFWVKLRQRGYTRSITNIPKPYEEMLFPGQRVQIDVKFVPSFCLVGLSTQILRYLLLVPFLRQYCIFSIFARRRGASGFLALPFLYRLLLRCSLLRH